MLRDLLSHRAIQVGLVFFVLVASGSLLYSWHVQRTMKAESARRAAFLQEREKLNALLTTQDPIDTSTRDVEHAQTPFNISSEVQMSDDTEGTEAAEFADVADAFLPDGFVSEEEPIEEMPVSPFGFGPYPEVPADYPFTPFWLRPPPKGNKSRERLMRKELISRVMVKAWTEGDHDFVGATGNGSGDEKVYLTYPNVIYVEYGEPEEIDEGVLIRPIKDALSASYTLSQEEMRNGEIPADLTVIEYDDAGYDPYTYLDLR